jgi:hypothetical protein
LLVSDVLDTEHSLKTQLMVRELGNLICSLNLTRHFFNKGIKETKAAFLFQANLRHLRLQEHCAMLDKASSLISDIKAATEIQECQLRDACQFGDFPDIEDLLEKEKRLSKLRLFGRIVEILGSDWLIDEEILNQRCHVLLFADKSRDPVIIKEDEILPQPPSTSVVQQEPAPFIPACLEEEKLESIQAATSSIHQEACMSDTDPMLEVNEFTFMSQHSEQND